MTEKSPQKVSHVGTIIVAVIVLAIGGGVAKTFREDFVPIIGYWGGVVAGGVAFGIAVLVICLVFKMGWRKGLAVAATLPVCMISGEEISKAIEPSVGAFPSHALGGIGAIVLGLIVAFSMTRLLKIQWREEASAIAQILHNK